MHRNHFSNKKYIFTLSFLSKITKNVLVLNHVPIKLFSPRYMIYDKKNSPNSFKVHFAEDNHTFHLSYFDGNCTQ